MKQIEINWSIVCYDDYTKQFEESILEYMNSEYFCEILLTLKQETIIVLWWDGTMLRAVRAHYEKNMAFLWINFWHKWFLLNSKDFIKPNLSFESRKYPLLEIEINYENTKIKDIALNEADIRAWNGKMVSLDIYLSDKQLLNIEWDGIIISTPAWSTGYNSSLRWPIIPHTLNAFVITPKSPWKPKWQTPILINDSENILVKNVWRRHNLEIYCDGREVLKTIDANNTDINIKKSYSFINLLIAKDYINLWDHKVMQEQWFELNNNY